MWLYGGILAAEAPAPAGVSDQLIIMVGGVITAAIVALGGVLVAVVNSRAGRTTPSPPSPTPQPSSDHVLYERTAVLTRRADDGDERFDQLDRAQTRDRDDLDDVIHYLDRRDPDWRP